MSHRDERHLEPPSLDLDAGIGDAQICNVQELVLFQLAAQERERHVRAVHRHVELCQKERHAADVVFMRVRQEESANFMALLDEIRRVIDDEIDPQHLFFRELHAGVDDDDVVLRLVDRGVAADLAAATERNDPEVLTRGRD